MKKTCFNVIRVLSYFGTVIFGILMMREYDRVYYSNEVGTSFSERFSALCPFVVFTLICILITLLNDMFLKERGNRDRLHFTVIGDTFLLLILFVVFIVLGVKGACEKAEYFFAGVIVTVIVYGIAGVIATTKRKRDEKKAVTGSEDFVVEETAALNKTEDKAQDKVDDKIDEGVAAYNAAGDNSTEATVDDNNANDNSVNEISTSNNIVAGSESSSNASSSDADNSNSSDSNSSDLNNSDLNNSDSRNNNSVICFSAGENEKEEPEADSKPEKKFGKKKKNKK